MKNNSFSFNVVRQINNMSVAGGKKRVFYSILNILFMAIGVFAAICVKWSWDFMVTSSFVAGILAFICSCAFTLCFFLQGFVAQFSLTVISLIGIFRSEERTPNIIAFVIALLTSVGLAATAVILLLML